VKISEVVTELQRFQNDMGDLPVVLRGGLGDAVNSIFWDEDENNATVIVVGW
jgi:hypothetical protein